MIPFTYRSVAIGVVLALAALCTGQVHGLLFGAREESIRELFRSTAAAHALELGSPEKAQKAVEDGWKYLKRAHEHFMGLGAAALVLCLFIGLSPARGTTKTGIATLVGFGAVCYPAFWTLTAFRTPAMGAHAAKESLALMAQAGAGAGFIGLVATTALAVWWALRADASATTLPLDFGRSADSV